MSQKLEQARAAVDKAVERYAEHDVFRAGVQSIPYIGGPIDTLLSGRASRIQMKRLEQFVVDLRTRLERVELIRADVSGDEFADFMLTAFEKVWRARTTEKRERFADIVARQVIDAQRWDDAEMALRLVGDLEDIHIDVLCVALAASPATDAFAGIRIVALDVQPGEGIISNFSTSLVGILGTRYSSAALRLACSELTARGLLHDEGVSRWDSIAMTYFVATDLAEWLNDWLRQIEVTP